MARQNEPENETGLKVCYSAQSLPVPEGKRISLAECRRVMNTRGVKYSDEELIEIRDWMYRVAETILDANDRAMTNTEQKHYKEAA